MKLMFISDIHGDAECLRRALEIYERERPERLFLLGDILYHGPRNNIPAGYDPKRVAEMLNAMKNHITAVRGNCEAEVDQMMLSFPVMAEYSCVFADGISMFLTHGHIYNEDSMPPLSESDILIHGHTHIPVCVRSGDNTVINPGSISLPKGGNPKSLMLYNNRIFSVIDLDGNLLFTHEV